MVYCYTAQCIRARGIANFIFLLTSCDSTAASTEELSFLGAMTFRKKNTRRNRNKKERGEGYDFVGNVGMENEGKECEGTRTPKRVS